MHTSAGDPPGGPTDLPSGDLPATAASVPTLVRRALGDHRVRFLVVGGGSAAVEFLLFGLLVRAEVLPAAANALSFVVGLLLSFTGYRLWSFAGDHVVSGRAQFVGYVSLALVNVAITSTLIHLMVSAGTAPWVAKLACMAMVTTWNFFLLNRVIFRRRSPADAAPAGPDEP